jgi:hypothetical protein
MNTIPRLWRGKGRGLKLPGKIFKGALNRIVPQTDTGEKGGEHQGIRVMIVQGIRQKS